MIVMMMMLLLVRICMMLMMGKMLEGPRVHALLVR